MVRIKLQLKIALRVNSVLRILLCDTGDVIDWRKQMYGFAGVRSVRFAFNSDVLRQSFSKKQRND